MSVGEVSGPIIARPVERSAPRRGMSIGEAVRVALQGLASNKLRSLLTMLGIIIGVGSVIAMMAIGEGANQAARATLQAMGPTSWRCAPGSSGRGESASALAPSLPSSRKTPRRS